MRGHRPTGRAAGRCRAALAGMADQGDAAGQMQALLGGDVRRLGASTRPPMDAAPAPAPAPPATPWPTATHPENGHVNLDRRLRKIGRRQGNHPPIAVWPGHPRCVLVARHMAASGCGGVRHVPASHSAPSSPPYLRHPFHTVAVCGGHAAGDRREARSFAGIGAGGSEVTGAAHRVRARDVAGRASSRWPPADCSVAADGVLDASSGRRLDVPLAPVQIMVAGRGDRVLTAAGRVADGALLWAIPSSDLDRSVSVVRAGAREHGPDLVWAPLVVPPARAIGARVRVIAAYGIVNDAAGAARTVGCRRRARGGRARRSGRGGGATAAGTSSPRKRRRRHRRSGSFAVCHGVLSPPASVRGIPRQAGLLRRGRR